MWLIVVRSGIRSDLKRPGVKGRARTLCPISPTVQRLATLFMVYFKHLDIFRCPDTDGLFYDAIVSAMIPGDTMSIQSSPHTDVLIVGAGLSGICAAYYVQIRCPTRSYAILECRDTIGGTWDLFRYPGVRSDSDMHTLGYSFRPWRGLKSMADGPSILRYIEETAQEYGIDHRIRFGYRVQRAAWSSAEARWSVDAIRMSDGAPARFTCSFLFMCTGYYDYAQGYTPDWPDLDLFRGLVIHPQRWPTDLDYAGKRIIVIGSGATAVTLAPALAERAAHVTILQRSPTYVVALPAEDPVMRRFYQKLPPRIAYHLSRWWSIGVGVYFYTLARRQPDATRRNILTQIQAHLGPDFDVETHFNPHYNPWDQRLCVAPDGDLFRAIKSGRIAMVTGQIERFTETGIRLVSGTELNADIIVTATGLVLKLMGGAQIVVDGTPVDPGKTLTYRGAMFSDVPNLALAFGYTNASWTLKCELIAQYVCRLLNYMEKHGYARCTPRRPNTLLSAQPAVTLTSGYIQRALDVIPRQGERDPWKAHQNYLRDLLSLRFGRLNDGSMEFARLGQLQAHAVRGVR
ncbi:MAG: flavin-binding family monooxygenase [Roseiflexus sp.]|nr:NAD(P)/FAD-dependent oxidoreductase [Roseiflexus sp.]GIW02169.1 MAG: flavin-binding family monooxygenase [Roseiflexus sp.]